MQVVTGVYREPTTDAAIWTQYIIKVEVAGFADKFYEKKIQKATISETVVVQLDKNKIVTLEKPYK